MLKALAESKAELPGAIGGEAVDVRCQELNGVKTAAACLGVVLARLGSHDLHHHVGSRKRSRIKLAQVFQADSHIKT